MPHDHERSQAQEKAAAGPIRGEAPARVPSNAKGIFGLQRAAGNRAVAGMLKPSGGGPKVAPGIGPVSVQRDNLEDAVKSAKGNDASFDWADFGKKLVAVVEKGGSTASGSGTTGSGASSGSKKAFRGPATDADRKLWALQSENETRQLQGLPPKDTSELEAAATTSHEAFTTPIGPDGKPIPPPAPKTPTATTTPEATATPEAAKIGSHRTPSPPTTTTTDTATTPPTTAPTPTPWVKGVSPGATPPTTAPTPTPWVKGVSPGATTTDTATNTPATATAPQRPQLPAPKKAPGASAGFGAADLATMLIPGSGLVASGAKNLIRANKLHQAKNRLDDSLSVDLEEAGGGGTQKIKRRF